MHYKNTIWLLLLLAFVSSPIAQEVETSMASEKYQKPLRIYENLGGDFELTGPEGKEMSSEIFRGKVMLIYFGYTYCPDVCPMVLSHLKKGMLDLKEQAKDVQVLFISIDPERDTHEKLKDYVPYFYPTFIGLTGSVNDITEVAQQYGVGYFKQYVESVEGYFMAHIDAVFLVDQEGRYIGRYKTKWDMEKLITDIQLLFDSG